MKYKLKVYSIQEFGQRKDSQGNPHQEDSMFPEYGKQTDDDRLFILCDGMGGHDAGEVASATVCEAMSQSIINDGHDSDGVFTPEDFHNALDAAFEALDIKDSGAEKKMGTTMTLLKLHSKGATIAHMGDSRVYHIRPGKTGEETQIVFQTEDHSLVNDLIKVGELTKEEAQFSRQKNVITRAMQPNMDRRPKADLHESSDVQSGDYFYLCSDGMLEQPEMENGESLRNIFSEMGGTDENQVEILKSVTEKNRDNHTAFIIHILEVIDPIEKTPLTDGATEEKVDKFTAIVEEEQTPAESTAENETDEESGTDDSDKKIVNSINSEETTDTKQLNNNPCVQNKLSCSSSSEESTDTDTVTSSELNANSGGVLPTRRRLRIRGEYPLFFKFAVIAIVAVAIILGIAGVRSCLSDKSNSSGKKSTRKTERIKRDNRHSSIIIVGQEI